MKKVIIEKLVLRNFRGLKDLEINFNANGETTVSGDNATGKSTIFNAFCWLLFGKDSQGRKDFEIRPIVDGELLRRVDCEVFGNFLVDDENISLHRVFKEKWVKPRGQVEEVFKGNETETFWNEAPINVTEYQKRINEIIPDSIFKMITIPSYFPTLDWKLQREQLFQLAGTITDNEIAANKPEYVALLDKISGKSLTDFKREISARKRKLKDELEQIQPRIDQTHKLMPENADFTAIEKEIESLEKQIKAIDDAIGDKTKAIRMQYEAAQSKQGEVNALKEKRQKVLHEAKTEAKEKAFEANANRRELEGNIKIAESEISTLERSVGASELEMNTLKKRIEGKEKEVESKRQEWHKENATEYVGNDTCVSCGQLLPEEKRSNARQMFVDAKQDKLTKINEEGGEIKAEIDGLNESVTELETRLKTAQSNLETKQGELANLKDELVRMPQVDETEVKPENLPEYVELSLDITKLESEINQPEQAIDTSELQTQKKELTTKLDTAKGELKNRDLIAKYKAEISELEEKGKQIAQQIADVEREEYTIQNFTKAKIDECERRINSLFSMVTFKLFEYTIDGNESETCVPLVDGVPFQSANTAGQIQGGLDIITALQKYHNIIAPIFCDNAESVNQYPAMDNQMVFLKVTNDKTLIVK